MHQLQCAVVIATKNRHKLLTQRSLPSVLYQTLKPDYLIVVDDSDEAEQKKNKSLINSLIFSDCAVVYLKNQNHCGASGSWNTAIDYLFANNSKKSQLYIAFLDDDDSWESSYLEVCIDKVVQLNINMVATGIRRKYENGSEDVYQYAPDLLKAEEFLIGNPGIQCSNLFLSLNTFLAAGKFDESLPSSTDRDLCIRLADLGTVRYVSVKQILVNHFVEPERLRLSTPMSLAKNIGLETFWNKYSGRMNKEQRQLFVLRSKELFNWQPSRKNLENLNKKKTSNYKLLSDVKSFTLIVGCITSDPVKLKPLLTGLTKLSLVPYIQNLLIVVLANGCDETQLKSIISEQRKNKLRVAIILKSQQVKDALRGSFGREFLVSSAKQVGIAQARTMIQSYVGEMQRNNENSYAWILDDDMRIDDRATDYLTWLPKFANENVDVIIGQYEGSSPNPAVNGIRVQLVDIYHNMLWLQNLDSTSVLPNRSAENALMRQQFPDYYYDLSRKHKGHLERPYWIEPITQSETVGEARKRIVAGAVGILTGFPLSRSLVGEMANDSLPNLQKSVNRGGNTFILNYQALTQTPNTILKIGEEEARRSDMIWAIISKHYRQFNIMAAPFPVVHVGRVSNIPQLNIKKVQSEIVGAAIYAGLSKYLQDEPNHTLKFSNEEIEKISNLIKQHLVNRLNMLEQSFHRIMGLKSALQKITKEDELGGLLTYLHAWFSIKNFSLIRNAALQISIEDKISFLYSLTKTADEFAECSVDTSFIESQLQIVSVQD